MTAELRAYGRKGYQRPVKVVGSGSRRLTAFKAPYGLTDEESDILYELREGLSDWQIALEFGSTQPSVAQLVESIKMKMNVRSRTEAAVKAIREGIFIPE